eukprot:TRINITY_DN4959_c0_g3_i1.p1 TRINITY_DN4959_c0_g3~~TRINITY_DN4959_c0_g3_i1.p1  ORF type:complete len:309 (-),score=60.87 TRINITY_DN4959_c0_g3_i1:1056-1982(-)
MSLLHAKSERAVSHPYKSMLNPSTSNQQTPHERFRSMRASNISSTQATTQPNPNKSFVAANYLSQVVLSKNTPVHLHPTAPQQLHPPMHQQYSLQRRQHAPPALSQMPIATRQPQELSQQQKLLHTTSTQPSKLSAVTTGTDLTLRLQPTASVTCSGNAALTCAESTSPIKSLQPSSISPLKSLSLEPRRLFATPSRSACLHDSFLLSQLANTVPSERSSQKRILLASVQEICPMVGAYSILAEASIVDKENEPSQQTFYADLMFPTDIFKHGAIKKGNNVSITAWTELSSSHTGRRAMMCFDVANCN